MNYICPVCKKEYATIAEVAKCLEKCAEADKKTKIAELDNKVKNAYSELKKVIEEYNTANADDRTYSCNLISHSVRGKRRLNEIQEWIDSDPKELKNIKKCSNPQSCDDPIGYFENNKIKKNSEDKSQDMLDSQSLKNLIDFFLR